MSDELKKLLEGLPIRILDKNCAEIGGGRYLRSQIQRWADDEANGTSHRLGARLILALMDEFEEPKKKSWDYGAVGGQSSECAPEEREPNPAPRKEAIAELARQEQADGHYVCEPRPDPFQGRHWDAMKADSGFYATRANIVQCICDLADEVRRIREGK